MSDLVLAVVKNRTWQDLDIFALSLEQSGYTGRRVMLVEDVPMNARENLKALGFEVEPCFASGPQHFQTVRYRPAYRYLQNHGGEFDHVFWTDACDVAFQSNPSLAIQQVLKDKPFAFVKEGWKIKDQPMNKLWIEKLHLPQDETKKLMNDEVLCSGTIAATDAGMYCLFHAMCNYPDLDAIQGMDQGLFNYLARSEPFGWMSHIARPEEAFVSTLGIFLAPSEPEVWTIKPPVLNFNDGTAWTPVYDAPSESGVSARSKMYAIIHQYNRRYGRLDPQGQFRECVERRYRR